MATKQQIEIHVRVLQNGHPVVECVKPVNRHLSIDITSNYTGDLAIPLYPLASDIRLFYFENNELFLNLDQPWSGFLTTKGISEEISASERESKSIPLTVDDYGTFSVRDMRVMFQVRRKKKERKSKRHRSREYGSNFFKQLFPTKSDVKTFLASIFLTGVVLIGLFFGLMSIDQKRPRDFQSLSEIYTLPFISREHLRFSPEALQGNLNRSEFVPSTIKYFRALTNMITGFEIGPDQKLLHKPSIQNYSNQYGNSQRIIRSELGKQQGINEKRLEDRTLATLYIPAVIGEAFNKKLERLMDKLDLVHESFDVRFLNRVKIAKAFSQDELYDWVNYHQKNNNRKYARDFLSRIRVFKGLSNEEQMYAVANNLAVKAQNMQKRFSKSTNVDGQETHEARSKQIFLPSGINFASFVNSAKLLSNDERLGQIRASSFDKKRKSAIKEPLIGKINPALISRAVKKRQFELQLCYDLALRRNQGTRGAMDWQWRIDSRGRISDIILTNSTIRDRKMVECIRRKMAIWRFPRPKRGSVEVNHSFYFSPQKG